MGVPEEMAAVCRQFPIVLAYQFGSSVRGRPGPMSDVDLAVLFAPAVKASEYLGLQLELLRALDPVFDYAPVDLVVLNRAGPLLRDAVIGGRLLYARDPEIRLAFEQATRRDYLDTAYLRRVHAQALLARLKEGALGDPSRVYFVAA